MLCSRPYKRGVQEFGCGQCMPCRVNRRREWAARITLESAAHVFNSFVTLTYDPDHLPPGESLSRVHYRAFTKAIGFRYFGCGEYGELGGRPHYHFILFGLHSDMARQVSESRWRYGHVLSMPMLPHHASYIAGYVVKKWTNCQNPDLEGRSPEFATMSRRPAIGSAAVYELARRTLDRRQLVEQNLEVVNTVYIDGKPSSIGRTLTDKVRRLAGIPEEWKVARGFRSIDYAQKVQAYPQLIADREVKRITQGQRAAGLSLRRKGVL